MHGRRLFATVAPVLGVLGSVWVGTPPARAQESIIAPEVAALYNVLHNPGFEEGGKMPTGWGHHPPAPRGGNQLQRDTEVRHSGRASGLINWVAPLERSGMQWNQQHIPVDGGSTLIASFYAKTEGVSFGRVGAHFYAAASPGRGRGEHVGFKELRDESRSGDWFYIRGEIPTPQAAAELAFAAYALRGGKTWFDDVYLLATPSARAVRATPTIDGKFDEDCWSATRPIGSFVEQSGSRLANGETRAWVAYDDGNLYVAFQCPQGKKGPLKPGSLEESVEVFLDPLHGHQDYYHVTVNSKGAVRSTHGRDLDWDSGVQSAVSAGNAGWAAEFKIPCERLGLGPEVTDTWGLNLVRNDCANGELAVWSLGGLHRPVRFGNVTGIGVDVGPYVRAELKKRAAQLRASRAAALAETDTSGLTRDQASEALRLLGQAQSEIAKLERVAVSVAKMPACEARPCAVMLASAAERIADARIAARSAVYAFPAGRPGGFRTVVAHSMQKIPRTEPVLSGSLPVTTRVQLEAARDETESFQVVVVPGGESLKDLRVDAEPLRGPGGAALPMEWSRVGYVEMAKPVYRTEYVGWWPDVLIPGDEVFKVVGDQRQPIWFRVNVPPDARPGLYKGRVRIACGAQTEETPVELRVRTFRLPRPGTLPVAFGIYAQALSKWYQGESRYLPAETYRRWCEFAGRYRFTPKNVGYQYADSLKTLLEDLGQRYFPDHSFAIYRLPLSGSGPHGGRYTGDWTIWARDARRLADAYQKLAIGVEPYIYVIDEPQPKGYPFLKEAYTALKKTVPEYPLMQTVDHRPPHELTGLVDVWCVLTREMDKAPHFYQQRLRAGDRVFLYVACWPTPPHANFYIDIPAIDHRVLFWQARQVGATGFLYWSTTWWEGLPGPTNADGPYFPRRPVKCADLGTYHSFKVNGDGILIWPGPDLTPWPSLRLEVIRDGIEDYEYHVLLDACIEEAKRLPPGKRPPAPVLKQADALRRVPKTISRTFTDFTKDPEAIFARRKALGDMIERLLEALGEQPPPKPFTWSKGG